jgi:SEC-C motif domain protein
MKKSTSVKQCPCGSNLTYFACCEQYLNHQAIPNTPEALMRSRYTAYTLANIDYIKKTMQGAPLLGFNEIEVSQWSKSVVWLGLKVIDTHQKNEKTGYVEFVAKYLDKNLIKAIHEESEFQAINGRWFYIDGRHVYEPTIRIARNAPCPCGSNKKFKSCHAQD